MDWIFKAYVPQPTSHTPPVVVTSNLSQLYAQNPPPSFVRPPINNTDPRVQDTVELCNFVFLTIKVIVTISYYLSLQPNSLHKIPKIPVLVESRLYQQDQGPKLNGSAKLLKIFCNWPLLSVDSSKQS